MVSISGRDNEGNYIFTTICGWYK